MLYLASQSPRRAELLSQLQVEFTPLKTEVDESVLSGEKPGDYVLRLAVAKAKAGLEIAPGPGWVLGSDTSVVANEKILGKPKHKGDFEQMMAELSGNSHQVMTAVALVNSERTYTRLVVTDVTFKPLSQSEIDWYWQTTEPADKAGGYGIQGLGGQFVTRINGSYSAVVGLPLYETAELLKQITQD